MSEPRFESPLQGFANADAGMAISMREITDRGMIDLRGEPGDRKFMAAVKKVIGVGLPTTPRTSTSAGDITVLWLSIDQWLVCCPRERAGALTAELRKALGKTHSLAVDMSDARAIIRLEGETVRETLMKGAPVDLTMPEYVAGTVRRLRFGDVAAMIHIVEENPDEIDLYVFRSYADYAWDWLVETGRSAAQIKLFGEQTLGG
jgi:sarcosine oxidase subunit gamma